MKELDESFLSVSARGVAVAAAAASTTSLNEMREEERLPAIKGDWWVTKGSTKRGERRSNNIYLLPVYYVQCRIPTYKREKSSAS